MTDKKPKNVGRPWTEPERQFLRLNIHLLTYKKMAEILERSIDSVRHQGRLLGIFKLTPEQRKQRTAWNHDQWTEQEESFIRKNIELMTYDEMGKAIKRTGEAVRARCQRLRIAKLLCATDKERYQANEAFIRENYKELTHQQMADILGIKVQDVSRICSRRKLYKEDMWTPEQDALMLSLIKKGVKPKNIALSFPTRTLAAVRQHIRKLLKGRPPRKTSKKAA